MRSLRVIPFVLSTTFLIFLFFQIGCKKENNNRPPVINNIELDSLAVRPGGTINITVYAEDPDGDQLSYSFSVSNGSIVGSGATVQIIAPMAFGIYNLDVRVSDGVGGESTAYEIFYVNSKPIIYAIDITPNNPRINETVTIKVNAFDPDEDELIYDYFTYSGVINGTGSEVFWTVPNYEGMYDVEVTVSDNKNDVKAIATIFVYENYPPVINDININPSTINVGGIVDVIVNAYDADGDSLTYSYTVTGGAIQGVGASAIWTAPNTPGAYSVVVDVSDGNGSTVSGDGTLTVFQGQEQAKVIGTAQFPAGTSGDLSNSKVSLYTSFENWNANQPIMFGFVNGSGGSVTFEINDVTPGNYYLDVWKDIDNNSFWSDGDYVGWYGSGGLGSPNVIEFQIVQGQTFNCSVNMYIIAKSDFVPK